jgi:hypothetical protein
MRYGIVFLLITLLAAATARADSIRYDQIPADATGYFCLDTNRLLSSQLWQQMPDATFMASQFNTIFGQYADISLYTLKTNFPPGSPDGYVFLWHTTDPQVLQRLKTEITGYKQTYIIFLGPFQAEFPGRAGSIQMVGSIQANNVVQSNGSIQAKGSVQVQVEGPDQAKGSVLQAQSATITVNENQLQEIYMTTMSPAGLLSGMSPNEKPQQAQITMKPSEPAKGSEGSFRLGLGNGQITLDKGPCYIAFVGQDSIVIAGDIPSMAQALSVMQGNTPSLATQDPQSLKVDAPPGAIMVGAGIMASFSQNNTGAAGGAAQSANNAAGLGFDFGSLEANAQLARFDMGEDQQHLYIDASVAMNDSDSAGQLKNLVLGVKALICLSQADKKPLLDPLQIDLSGKNVALHWSWPTAKLPELFRLTEVQNAGDHSQPAAPATQPIH